MKIKKSLSAFLVLALCPTAFPAYADTLDDVLLYAYETNPSLEASRAYFSGISERLTIARAAFLPTLGASGTYAIRREKAVPMGMNSIHDESQPFTGRLSAGLNLFDGFSSMSEYRAAEATVKAAEQSVVSTEQDILLSAGTSFFDVLRDEALLELQKNNESILAKHLESYRQRLRVGVLTKTDIDQSVSRLERAKAGRIAAEGQLSITKAAFRSVVGKNPQNLEVASEKGLSELVPKHVDDAIKRGLDSNPSLLQQLYQERSAQESVKQAEAGHYPKIDLAAYADKAYADYHNNTTPYGDTWFAGVTVTLPLYTGGATQAAVRQAKGLAAQSRLTYVDLRRRIAEQVTSAYLNYETSLAQIDAIKSQITAARSALNGVTREAQVGSRTILDILDAQQELLNAEVSLVEARRNASVAAMTLAYTMGGLTKKGLNL